MHNSKTRGTVPQICQQTLPVTLRIYFADEAKAFYIFHKDFIHD